MSLAIWGLVVSKAKSGLDAATKTDEQSVGAIVKKVGIFTALIALASVCQLMGNANTPSPVEAATQVSSSSHKLQASRESHPASYYDKSSPHYMGGAHNVHLMNAGNKKAHTASYYDQSSSHYMGGAHNVLLSIAKESMKSGKALQMPSPRRGNMGHNLILDIAQESKSANVAQNVQIGVNTGKVSIPSQKSMGGSHNVAMAVL